MLRHQALSLSVYQLLYTSDINNLEHKVKGELFPLTSNKSLESTTNGHHFGINFSAKRLMTDCVGKSQNERNVQLFCIKKLFMN